MKKNKTGQISNHKLKINYSGNSNFMNLLKIKNRDFIKLLCFTIIMISSQIVFGQSSKVKINVLDDDGKPFKGVLIQSIENAADSTRTNAEGYAAINIAAKGFLTLSFSDMQKTIVAKSDIIRVILGRKDKKVNLGYGISKALDELTSSIDLVYSNKLEKSSLNNPTESLYGQLSGLFVLQNSGTPWNRSARMTVRGRGTTGNNSILVLVDGFERDMATLSLADIESVSVLKDGTALARYGQRGANGVVFITTKRGEYDTFKVEVSSDQGINFAIRNPKFLGSYEYARAVNQASFLDGNSPVYSDQELFGFQSGENRFLLPNVNWFDETLREFGTTSNINTSFSGGGKNVKYFASLNYQNERGLFDNTTFDDRYDSQIKYDRLNFRTNIDVDLTKSTKLIVNVSGNIDGNTEPGAQAGGIINALFSVPSAAFPVRTENGQWGGTDFYNNNPVALVSSTGVRQPNGRQIMADGQIIQDLSSWVKGLSFEAALAYDNEVTYTENKLREFLYESTSYTRNPQTGEISDSFSNIFGDDTDLSFNNGFANQDRKATLYAKLNYDTSWQDNKLTTSVIYNQDKRVLNGQYNTFLRQNMILSSSYGYKNRYFIDGVVSYSGSSVLPEDNRFGIFPAISAGWIVNRENFLKNNKTIEHLKLRASWGISGNNIIPPNLYDQAFGGSTGYFFGANNNSVGGISEGRLASQGLTSENSIKTNIGVDLRLNGGLTMTVDAFYDKRENILVGTGGAIPSLIGVTNAIENAGEVVNRGIETSLLWRKEIGDFKYFLGGNFTFARNEIVEMNEEFRPYNYLNRTGNSIGQQFGLESLGFFENQSDIDASPQQLFSNVRPGDIKYKDQNNDNVIDELDEVAIGYSSLNPEIYYDFNLGFEVKGFGVDLLFQGIANQTVYLNTKSVFLPLRSNSTITNFSAGSWTPETAQTATLPRLSLLENENNYRRNDIWLSRGDYLKLRRFEIYFKYPESVINKLKLKKTKLYVRGMNVFSIDEIKIRDPEALGVGYPSLASYHVGIKLEF